MYIFGFWLLNLALYFIKNNYLLNISPLESYCKLFFADFQLHHLETDTQLFLYLSSTLWRVNVHAGNKDKELPFLGLVGVQQAVDLPWN